MFHRVQAEVYDLLLSGDNVILSAPTSFGKSLIIDAIIASQKFRNIAVIVPTVALIDETRRRMAKTQGYKVITHGNQAQAERNVFVMTQERILQHRDLPQIDFFVIDEFYKLHPRTEDNERSLELNRAFYHLYRERAQFYLLGPAIDSISRVLQDRIKFRFFKTDYATVASEIHRLPRGSDNQNTLLQLRKNLQDPTLVYCNSHDKIRKTATAMIEAGISDGAQRGSGFAEWVADNYHPDWLFVRALDAGIGIHHGRLPRSLAQQVVREFNDGRLRFLLCTSTLIEGVNTKARNVVIYDNKIALKNFDFFTYNNIKGRSGRMFQHFVGHVYVFHDPPPQVLPTIDIPVITQPQNMADTLLLHIDEQDLLPESRRRLSQLAEDSLLPIEILKENGTIDPTAQNELALEIESKIGEYWPQLRWTHNPSWDQLLVVCDLIWRFIPPATKTGAVFSSRHLAYKINQLRKASGIGSFIRSELANERNKTPDEIIETAIDFLRRWAEHDFPRRLRALDRIQNHVFGRAARKPGSYGLFASQVERWFIDPALLALDEYGIPIQIGEKLSTVLNTDGDLDIALQRLKELNPSHFQLSQYEHSVIRDAQQYL